MSGNKNTTPSTWVDPDDAPKLSDEFFVRADEFIGDKLVRRGRPPSDSVKRSVTVRYDADVIAAFRSTGKGWQTRMNEALREWIQSHPEAMDNPSR
jgi:uncharacterized protein (DUF4415 family)